MIYKKIISVLENDIDKIVKKWTEEVTGADYMETYQAKQTDIVYRRGEKVYENLIRSLGDGRDDNAVQKYFEDIGAERNIEGFPLSEVIFALYLTRKVLWEYLFKDNGALKEYEKKETIEFIGVLNNYFDRGNFFIMRGYLGKLFVQLDESRKFSKDELKNMLLKGALYKETLKPVGSQQYDIGFKIGVITKV